MPAQFHPQRGVPVLWHEAGVTDDCGACERVAVRVDSPEDGRKAGRALQRLGARLRIAAVARTQTTARRRAGKARKTDGRK